MIWDFGALGPAKEVFERVDHRHLDDLLPGLPAPCEDTAQVLADYLGDQLTRTDLPFAHLVGDVSVLDALAGRQLTGVGVGRPAVAVPRRPSPGRPARWPQVPTPTRSRVPGRRSDRPGGDRHARVRAAAAEAFLRHELHQRSLNEVLGPNPTAEQLAAALGAHFVGELQIPGVVRVLVAETPATLAVWRPAETRP
jgi:hypothetical protein